jgi:protein SCO1/2
MTTDNTASSKRRINSLRNALSAVLLGGITLASPLVVSASSAPPGSPVTVPPTPPSQPNKLAVWPQGAGSPTFELLDTDGAHRTLRDYRGRIVVIFFGFMHCPDACPAGLFKLAQVMRQLGQGASQVQVLFITLDPERDTPASLKSYTSAFNPRFVGLTGTSGQVDQAASNFNVQYARVPLGNDYTIDHSTGIFVFDTSGRLRLVGAVNSPVADFVHDITALVAEQPVP